MTPVPPCAAPSTSYDAAIAAYYTVISIVIVYHLFALQSWLGALHSVVRECIAIERTTVMGDVRRVDLVEELEQAQRAFPWSLVLVLGVAVGILGGLAIFSSTWASLPFLFWGTPTIVLWLVFVASTFSSLMDGWRSKRKTRKLLMGGR